MLHDDNYMRLQKESEEDELILELDKQYYNIMGCLLYKKDYIDALNQGNYKHLFYYIMLFNVSNTH